jgi:UDP-N-acetylglucosamine 2-epimerase
VNPERHASMSKGSGVFGDGHASKKIVRILEQNLTTASRILPFEPAKEKTILRQ